MAAQSQYQSTTTNPLSTYKDLNGVNLWSRSAPNKSTDASRQWWYLPAATEVTVTIPNGCNAVIISPDSSGIGYRIGSEAIVLPTTDTPTLGVISEASVIAPIKPGDTLRMISTNTAYVGLDFRLVSQ